MTKLDVRDTMQVIQHTRTALRRAEYALVYVKAEPKPGGDVRHMDHLASFNDIVARYIAACLALGLPYED